MEIPVWTKLDKDQVSTEPYWKPREPKFVLNDGPHRPRFQSEASTDRCNHQNSRQGSQTEGFGTIFCDSDLFKICQIKISKY